MSDKVSDGQPDRPGLRLAMAQVTLGPGTAPAGIDRTERASGLVETEVHLTDYVRILHKRRWTALTAFLLIVVSVTVYTFTATPIFEAKTRLLIEADTPNVVSFKEVINEELAKADYYQTQYALLQSRALARKTIESLKLWDSPPFGGVARNAGFSMMGAIAAAESGVVGAFRSAEPDKPAGNGLPLDETGAQSRAIDIFLSNLTVSPIRNSRLVDIKYDLPDADMASAIINALAKNYIEQNLEFKFMSSKEASDWLGQRLGEQRKQVAASEQAVQQYREKTDAVSPEEKQNIVVQKLADLSAAVTRAKTERIQKDAAYNQIRTLQNDRAALDTFPAILSNTFIQQQKGELADLQRQQAQLSDKLGPRHPDMVKLELAIRTAEAKIQGEIAKVVLSMHNDEQQAVAQEQSLTNALEQQKHEALALNRKGIEYGVLTRDAASNRQIFESLMQRTKETGISGELKTSNIRVVDLAERPRSPVSPNKQANMLLALVGGGMFAFGLTFFFEYLDSRVKSPEEIRNYLGLPFLGFLPALHDKAVKGYPLVSNGVPPHFSEAIRGIRTNVLFSCAQAGSRSIVVTSTGPNEGKSVVASNLAISMAQAGQRVLLIDADMRKPKVHEIVGVALEPGLSNLLVGNAKASESLRTSKVPGLWVLAAGRIPPNPAELIGSERFRQFLESLHEHFDWVVVDSPPVMAVTDAALAAHRASGVLFVVGAEMTSRHAAKRALEQLENAQARFVGAVLNRVDLQRNAYYYSQYYRREYTQYYAKSSLGGA